MGYLDGGIASLFGSVFGLFYLDGTITQIALAYDENGTTVETSVSQPCKYQEDMVSEETRASGNFSQDEKRFFILQSGISGAVNGDAVLTVSDGTHYALRNPEQDPAKSYWLARGVVRNAPPSLVEIETILARGLDGSVTVQSLADAWGATLTRQVDGSVTVTG